MVKILATWLLCTPSTASITLITMEPQMVTPTGTSSKTVSPTMLDQQPTLQPKLYPLSLALLPNIFNQLDFQIVPNTMKLVKPMKGNKVTSHSKSDLSHMMMCISCLLGIRFRFLRISLVVSLNLPSSMVVFQLIQTFTRSLPGTNQSNLVAWNLTLVTSSWMALLPLPNSVTRIYSSDIKDRMMILKFTQNGLHIWLRTER